MNIKKLSLLALLLCACAFSLAAQPRVLTVDNNPGAVAMFKTLQAAYDAAGPGDTLLIAGSATQYGELDVQKRLHLVGPGYLLAENNVPGLNKYEA